MRHRDHHQIDIGLGKEVLRRHMAGDALADILRDPLECLRIDVAQRRKPYRRDLLEAGRMARSHVAYANYAYFQFFHDEIPDDGIEEFLNP